MYSKVETVSELHLTFLLSWIKNIITSIQNHLGKPRSCSEMILVGVFLLNNKQ